MRKNLLLVIALVLTSQLLTAQGTYQRYLTANTSWYEFISYAIFSGSQPCYLGGNLEETSYYHVTRTDTIQGVAWYRVHRDWKEVTYCVGGPTLINSGPVSGPEFFIREDSSGKIFVQRPYPSPEVKLYDFGPAYGVGDTILYNDDTDTCVVGQVDSVYLGMDARARYWCDCQYPLGGFVPSYIIEGIGTSRNIVDVRNGCEEVYDAAESVICYQQNGNQVTIDSNHACGGLAHIILGFEDIDAAEFSWRWLQDGEKLTIEWPHGPAEFTYALYNLRGAMLHQGEGAGIIDASNLSSGLYVLRVRTAEGILAKKIFKP